MAANMRAKVRLGNVTPYKDTEGNVLSESLAFYGVARSDSYPEDGSDENNTFAKFSPSVDFKLTVANPALIGKFKEGEVYYVDFSPTE